MNRCIKLALVHDLAESLVGDLVPNEVTKDEKYRREKVVKREETCGVIFMLYFCFFRRQRWIT